MWEKIATAAPRQDVFSKLGSARLAEIPAGKLSDMDYLSKIAQESDELFPKKAAVQKRAEIRKRIIAMQPAADARLSSLLPRIKHALDASSPAIPAETLGMGHSLKEVITTMLALGMVPTASESKTLHDLFVGKPEGSYGICRPLASKLAPLIPYRSFTAPVLIRRISVLTKAPEAVKLAYPMMPPVPAPMRRPQQEPTPFDKGVKHGVLAALAFLLAPAGLKRFVLDHPMALLMAGAPLVTAGKMLTSNEPLVSGQYDLAGPRDSLYNDDWRSRFAKMQARPVTVIKTGEDLSESTKHFQSTWSGMSGLIGLADIWRDNSSSAVSEFGNQFPALLSESILSKSAQEIGEVTKMLKTASSLALGEDLSFDSLPTTNRTASGDLLILSLSEKLLAMKGERHNG
jgi:hypothetical protein